MLIKEKNNRGFTLVEVIVSMLVLSITIVSVLSAFTIAAKSNTKTKKAQEAESLLEDVLEYTKARSREFNPEKGLDELNLYRDSFGGSWEMDTEFSDTNDVEVALLKNVKEGFHKYTVKITRDRKPVAYTSGSNAHKTITFGETGSKTAVINVNIAQFDEDARDEFLILHKEKVDQHNSEVDSQLALNPDYNEKETIILPENTEALNERVREKMTREIWIETKISEKDSEKIQLVAYAVYTVTEDFMLPDGTDRQIKTQIFESEEYDLSTSTLDTAQKLKQLYVLYVPSGEAKKIADVDIRILDKANQLDANIFLAYQQSLVDLDDAITKNLENRYENSEQIKVSFIDAESAIKKDPINVGLYCSTGLSIVGGTPSTVSSNAQSLVASNQDVRIVTVNIEILDSETGNVLAETKEAVACLQ